MLLSLAKIATQSAADLHAKGATAQVHGLSLATRNLEDIEGLDLRLNPWKALSS
mgnify:CR=1 FL=1